MDLPSPTGLVQAVPMQSDIDFGRAQCRQSPYQIVLSSMLMRAAQPFMLSIVSRCIGPIRGQWLALAPHSFTTSTMSSKLLKEHPANASQQAIRGQHIWGSIEETIILLPALKDPLWCLKAECSGGCSENHSQGRFRSSKRSCEELPEGTETHAGGTTTSVWSNCMYTNF